MKKAAVVAALIVLSAALLPGQEKIDGDTNWRLRREANEHSQLMRTLHMLTDRYGPRLTGSPNYDAAAEWARGMLAEWGLKNAHLEPWDFGHAGWLNERAAGYMVAPLRDNLTFEVVGWTPSTTGSVSSSVVQVIPPLPAGKEELAAWCEANKDKVRQKIVLVGKAAVVPVSFNPGNKRLDEAEVRARFDAVNPQRPNFGGRPVTPPGKLTPNQATEMIDAWLVSSGALVKVNDAGMDHGEIRAFANRTYDVARAVPTVVLRNEDFGRVERLLADGTEVKLEFDIVNRTYPEGKTTYNVVAEIPGTDKAEEVVMLGGHLDSWHSATGATDNAIGVSVMMEAARMIQALGLHPRRTIRVGLWSAEEQGLLGSQAYVKAHFGTVEEPKAEFGSLVAYFNVDSGTGRVRGASVFGPGETAAVIREALAPFADLGVAGAAATGGRNLGGTDSTSFNAAGLAGIGLGQDPIEYGAVTWHTNLDTYERIIPEDAREASIVAAAVVWHVANREARLPAFSKEKMPAPPKPEGSRPTEPAKPAPTGGGR
jgi:carboxypeptidase Q